MPRATTVLRESGTEIAVDRGSTASMTSAGRSCSTPATSARHPERGLPDVVVWNRGRQVRGPADMAPDGWRRMLCVEAAVTRQISIAGRRVAADPGRGLIC
jgi:glucose-6-phosphate 1-epimerase